MAAPGSGAALPKDAGPRELSTVALTTKAAPGRPEDCPTSRPVAPPGARLSGALARLRALRRGSARFGLESAPVGHVQASAVLLTPVGLVIFATVRSAVGLVPAHQ